MAVLPEDERSTELSDDDLDADGETTTAQLEPPAALGDEEDSTVQQPVDPAVLAAMPSSDTSSSVSIVEVPVLPAIEEPDSVVTATAPRLRAPGFPLALPGTVEIRTVDPTDELLDETEVKTQPGARPSPPRALGTGRARATPPLPSPGPESSTKPGVASSDDYDVEESVTTRAPSVDAYADDSVTTLSPVSLEVPTSPAFAPQGPSPPRTARSPSRPADEETEGTTKKVKKTAPSPADEEAESITTQAPGHLTNMLRVIASEGPASAPSVPSLPAAIEDDEPPENRTAVMANAPLLRQARALAPAPLAPAMPDPSSESGLRLAPAPAARVDHASVGVLGVGPREPYPSGAARLAHPHDAASLGLLPDAYTRSPPSGYHAPPGQSVFPCVESPRPRYGLLVAVVLAMSLAIPVALYFALRPPAVTDPPHVDPTHAAPSPSR